MIGLKFSRFGKTPNAVIALICSTFFNLSHGDSANAALLVLSQSVEVNLANKSANFQIEFDQMPDFFTTDTIGRQKHSFQYYIDADGGFPIFKGGEFYYSNLESLIRGDEINLAGEVRIRNAAPPDETDPYSGGWGSIRGSVPYTLSVNNLSFSVPLQLIGDDDGKFSYQLMWAEYGGMGGYIEAEAVPEPATIFGSFMALGSLAAAYQRRNKQLKAPNRNFLCR